ncbi:MAG TPA: VWA domain-containing protein [Candidatus Elarobacter sp.]|nr:VWA domain-containing protein [Candidatus Elarobacter sp.]
MDFTESVAAFTAELREQHGFGAGQAATRDALRAAEIVGITAETRLRSAFRAVYCATPEEVDRFDAAFDAFFLAPRGVAQPNLRSRHTRPEPPKRSREEAPSPKSQRPLGERSDAAEDDDQRRPTERRPPDDINAVAVTWQTLRARYSAAAARGEPPRIDTGGLDEMFAAASRLVAGMRVARSRRWTPRRDGSRVDLRRTLRASVETAGDPVDLRRTARALRGARFVALIDGSRSAAEYAGPMLQFAYALVQRSRRVSAFAFSTELREVTRALRERDRAGRTLPELGEAWGGGTRIGANLATFVREHGARLLSPETIVLIYSDGLDTGDLDRLERTMRELRARSAAVIWLNPHAGAPGFTPSAGGMRTALPFVTALYPARDSHDFTALARALTRTTARRR